MKTNILVQYKGGGYDGCFWEWNYFYIDKQGMFHNIESSGRAGIDNLQDAEQLIIDDASGTYIYDLDNKQDITAFSKESNAIHVSGVLRWFEDYNSPNTEFFAVCSVCECRIDSCDDMMIESKDILCNECYCTGSCPCCESYVGDTKIVKVEPEEHHDFDYLCVDCKEYHDEECGQEQLENLRWQSFCTGKPDMFSGALRDARIENIIGGGM